MRTSKTYGRSSIKLSSVAVCAALTIGLLTACGDDGDGDSGDNIIDIASLQSLTGPGASVGVSQDYATKLAVKQLNESGGVDVDGENYTFELDTQDDKSDPTAGVTAVQKFLSDGHKFMVGTNGSAVAGAYVPIIADNEEFISIIVGAASSGLTDHLSVYRPRVTLAQYTDATVKYVQDQGYKTYAILTDSQHAAFVEETDPLIERLQENGTETVASESYKFGDTDFNTQLSNMLSKDPEALNLRGFPGDVARAIKQARQAGFDGPIITSSGITNADVEDAQAADQMAGVTDIYVPLPEDLIEGGKNAEQATAFEEDYQAEFNEPSAGTAMSAYDGIFILAAAMEKAGTVDDVAAIREALDSLTLDDVPELVEAVVPQDGDLIFAEHQAYFAQAVREWHDGKFETVSFIDAG
ncbi:ABC transporter substrate-binding protein [Cumulibacter soli]|uniref:ABC transporter substrate-binding protein n=1 Tax=Cumulibacter soli TaxID=2546344 RepID=UPI0010676659|nr:ABC transporter substrate-binding protein [Cumulibacter soli]